MLELNESGHTPFGESHYGDMAAAALMPNAANEISYFYREVEDKPIVWWEPLAWTSEIEALATGRVGQRHVRRPSAVSVRSRSKIRFVPACLGSGPLCSRILLAWRVAVSCFRHG